MNQLFTDDVENSIHALKTYIIYEEGRLSDKNAGDEEWNELEPYKKTLTNLLYIESIYG